MPNPKDIQMEHMSEAFLKALCAQNGYTMTKPSQDNEGADQIISCKDYPTDEHTGLLHPKFEVQLKSSYSGFKRNNDGRLVYKLRAKNYNDLVNENRATPLILVVLMMYEDEAEWTEQTEEYLKITRRAYWLNLVGQQPTTNRSSKNVDINENQILTAESLKELMIRAWRRERL